MDYNVIDARYVRDYVIWFRFKDGTEGEVDLSAELWGPVFEPLRDDRVLNRDVVRPRGRQVLVDAPGSGDVVDDRVLGVARVERVALEVGRRLVERPVLVAGAEAHIAHNDVAGADGGLPSAKHDAASRRGLPLKVEGVSDPADPDRELNENGGLLPGPGAIVAGPTFEEWLDATA